MAELHYYPDIHDNGKLRQAIRRKLAQGFQEGTIDSAFFEGFKASTELPLNNLTRGDYNISKYPFYEKRLFGVEHPPYLTKMISIIERVQYLNDFLQQAKTSEVIAIDEAQMEMKKLWIGHEKTNEKRVKATLQYLILRTREEGFEKPALVFGLKHKYELYAYSQMRGLDFIPEENHLRWEKSIGIHGELTNPKDVEKRSRIYIQNGFNATTPIITL